MNKRIFISATLFLLLILLNQSAYAIGIFPSRITLNFEPNLQVNETACIKSGGSEAADIYVEGELAQYITLSEDKIIFGEENIKCVSYILSLPSALTPGTNTATIFARESMAQTAGGAPAVTARAGVGQQIWVEVPYPGKYLTASLAAHDAAAGEPVEFTITLNNKGKEIISAVSGNIGIINQNNESLGYLPTTELTNFAPASEATLKAIWEPSSRDVGTYTAIAYVYYDGNTARAETSFKIGEMTLRIINVTSPLIEKGEIGKIDVLVESVWISSISDVYAEVKAAGKTVKSESVTVEPWSKKLILVYFPTEGLEAEEYPATAKVYYADKAAEKEFAIIVFEDKTMFYFMAGGSVVLAILILALIVFIISNRRFKKRMQHAMYIPSHYEN